MSVSWMEWNAVVPMPVVEGRLDLVWRDGGYDGPWRLRVMGLTWSMLVESSIVDNPSWTSVRFWSDNHPAAPCYRVIDWDLLQNTQTDIPVKAFFDSRFPMKWNLTWCVNGDWGGILINKDSEWW